MASLELSIRDAVLTVSPKRQSVQEAWPCWEEERQEGKKTVKKHQARVESGQRTARVLCADDVSHDGAAVKANAELDGAPLRVRLVNQGGRRRLNGVQRKTGNLVRVVLLRLVQVRHGHVGVTWQDKGRVMS